MWIMQASARVSLGKNGKGPYFHHFLSSEYEILWVEWPLLAVLLYIQ